MTSDKSRIRELEADATVSEPFKVNAKKRTGRGWG